jgi:sulfite exporter TauE/SafE
MAVGPDQLGAALLVGLLGGAHCVGMCAGIVGTLTMGLPVAVRSRPGRLGVYQLAYNLGRLGGYALAGALMGSLGHLAVSVVPVQYAQQLLYSVAAVFMILAGLYLGGWWSFLTRLERLGAAFWRRIEPLGRRLLPIRSVNGALGVGFVWAWIPCGLVYSVLVWSVSAGSALDGALLMVAFGIGTLPTLMGLGMLAGAAARVANQTWIRRLAGASVMAFGFYALWQLYLA